jgi:plasmid maintenance system killer protein
MDFEFGNRKLQKELSEERAMQRAYGQLTRALKNRLATLEAAATLAEIPQGPPDWLEQLKGDRDEQFSVVLNKNWRLVFEVANNPIPRLDDGGIDLTKATAIRFIEVVDYHKK